MRSTQVKKGSTRAAHRSLFYAMGYTEEELKKPLIGICCAANEIIPGHMHLDTIARQPNTACWKLAVLRLSFRLSASVMALPWAMTV